MKRTIAILLTCLLSTALLAGCGSSSNSDSTSKASDTSSVSTDSTTSDTSADNSTVPSQTSAETPKTSEGSDSPNTSAVSDTADPSQETQPSKSSEPSADTSADNTAEDSQSGITIGEDGNIIIDPNALNSGEWQEDSDTEEPSDTPAEESTPDDSGSSFLDLSYQMTYLSPAGFNNSVTLPATYYITSAAELNDFVENNKKTFSLDVPYTNDNYIEKIAFTSKIADMDNDYFSVYDTLIVVSAYNKDDECDLGSIILKGNDAQVEIWTSDIPSADKTGYICFVVNMEKGTLKGKNIVPTVTNALSEEDEAV